MIQERDKIELVKSIGMYIARNRNKKQTIQDSLRTIGFNENDINNVGDVTYMLNLTEEQLMIIAHRCDMYLNTTIFKSYDTFHRTWSDVPKFGDNYIDKIKSLTIYDFDKIRKDYYIGCTTINELAFAIESSPAILNTSVPYDKFQNKHYYTQIDNKDIYNIEIQSNDFIISSNSETIDIKKGYVSIDTLYMVMYLKDKLINSNKKITVYVLPLINTERHSQTYTEYISLLNSIIIDDINTNLQINIETEFESTLINGICKLVVDNIYLDYETKVKCVSQCLTDIMNNNITSKSNQLKLIRESIKNVQ